MDIRIVLISFMAFYSTGLLAAELTSTDIQEQKIYKSVINGRVVFSDQPCETSATVVQLKEPAATVASCHLPKMTDLDYTIESHLIKDRITRHQHKIKRYQQKMKAEIALLKKKKPVETKKHIKASFNNTTPVVPDQQPTQPSTKAQVVVKKKTNPPQNTAKPGKLKGSKTKAKNAVNVKNKTLMMLSGKDNSDALRDIAGALTELNTDKLSDQINAVTQYYSSLIRAEEFQITLLRAELQDLRE